MSKYGTSYDEAAAFQLDGKEADGGFVASCDVNPVMSEVATPVMSEVATPVMSEVPESRYVSLYFP